MVLFRPQDRPFLDQTFHCNLFDIKMIVRERERESDCKRERERERERERLDITQVMIALQ